MDKEINLKQILKMLEQIFEKTENIEGLQRVIVRKHLSESQKYALLREQIIRTNRMTSTQAEGFLGCSRKWAIKLLERIGKEPGFMFVPGKDKNPCRTMYSEARIILDRIAKLKALLDSKHACTFHEVQGEFGFDLPNAIQFCQEFCKYENDKNNKKLYQIKDVRIEKIMNA